jgi:hypothetical protein
MPVGNGPGPTVNISPYTFGPPRVTIQGTDPGRSVLFHRSAFSSACPPSEITPFADTLDYPHLLTSDQKMAMNKGVSLASYQTRNFQPSSQVIESNIVAQYMNKPSKGFSEGDWYGVAPIAGMNQQTRLTGVIRDNAKFKVFANIGPSATSYGSYGQC